MLDPTYSTYPRVYRASALWMILIVLCGVVLVIGGILAAWYLLHQASLAGIRFWLAGLCLPFIGLGVYALLVTFASSMTLFENRIEITDLKGTSVLFHDEIEAWRSAPESPSEIILVPNDKQRPPVNLSQLFSIDTQLVEWLRKIPRQESGSRQTSAALKGKWIAPALNICAVLIAFGLLLPSAIPTSPEPHRFRILAVMALPWICLLLVWKSHGFFHLRSRSKDPLSSLALFFSMPVALLMVRAFHYNIVDHAPVGKLAVFIAVMLLLTARMADKTARVVSLILLAAFYGYGFSCEANALFDDSTAATCRVSVRDKRIIPGKSRSYRLYFDPWGPLPDLNSIDVSLPVFNRIQSGESIKIVLKHGALGAPWYFIAQPF